MAKITRVNNGGIGKKKLKIMLDSLEGVEAKVGWFESAKYENGTPVAVAAIVAELGAPGKSIPPRPMFRPTIAENQGAWAKLAESGAKAVLKGNYTMREVMDAIGLQASGDVRKTIASITEPPLSILTLLARKHRRGNDADGVPNTVTGKTLGVLAKELDKGPPDVSGVSTKPLMDSFLMYDTLTYVVEDKK